MSLTYQCLAPGRHLLSPPLYRLLLEQPGSVWTCSPWELTGRRALLCLTEPPLRRLLLEERWKQDSLTDVVVAPGSPPKLTISSQLTGNVYKVWNVLSSLMKGRNQTGFLHIRMRDIPGADTCSGVVGTLRPPDSSSWGARNRGLSYIPRPENIHKNWFEV